MQSDEQIYELVAKELATSPRQGLLIKCMAKCEGDENKGRAKYIETRVDEIKLQIKKDLAKKKEENENKMDPIWISLALIVAAFVIALFIGILAKNL
jgi:hypothetical protein